MLHRGEIIEKAIRESGYSITSVAQRLGKSRRWMYFLFENPAVPLDLILQIGKILYHDFSHEIPEIIQGKFIVSEHEKGMVQEDAAYWKDKYYQLVDEHLEVVKQLREYEKKGKE
jgi:hypothetical protein